MQLMYIFNSKNLYKYYKSIVLIRCDMVNNQWLLSYVLILIVLYSAVMNEIMVKSHIIQKLKVLFVAGAYLPI